jgi:anti-sigma factor RsiW
MKLSRDLTCAELVELVTDYLEGRLAPAERARFEEHLGFCDWCAIYLEQMRQTILTVGRLKEEDLSPELQETLLDLFRGWAAG